MKTREITQTSDCMNVKIAGCVSGHGLLKTAMAHKCIKERMELRTNKIRHSSNTKKISFNIGTRTSGYKYYSLCSND
jgi:hypothetical protein